MLETGSASLYTPSESSFSTNDVDVGSLHVFDRVFAEKIKDCTNYGYPLCLDKALETIFGKHGRETVEEIARKGGANLNHASTAKEVWKKYESYLIALRLQLGDDVSQVIQHQSMKQMESMLCTDCPLYTFRK